MSAAHSSPTSIRRLSRGRGAAAIVGNSTATAAGKAAAGDTPIVFVAGDDPVKDDADGEPVGNPHMGAMTTPKASRADEAHIVTAEYRREQRAGLERMAQLKTLRLAQQAKTETPKPKRKVRAIRHTKTHGFGRWA